MTPGDKWMLAGLWLLAAVPAIAGSARAAAAMADGVVVTEANARFVQASALFLVHILASIVYSFLGPLQFADGLRLRHPAWHRKLGWLVVLFGYTAALTGLWMTWAFAIPPSQQGPLLKAVRSVVGIMMAAGLSVALLKVVRRDFQAHRDWMIRAYALGMGAGTQVFVLGPFVALGNEAVGFPRDLLMALSWAINAGVAEALIARARRVPSPLTKTPTAP